MVKLQDFIIKEEKLKHTTQIEFDVMGYNRFTHKQITNHIGNGWLSMNVLDYTIMNGFGFKHGGDLCNILDSLLISIKINSPFINLIHPSEGSKEKKEVLSFIMYIMFKIGIHQYKVIYTNNIDDSITIEIDSNSINSYNIDRFRSLLITLYYKHNLPTLTTSLIEFKGNKELLLKKELLPILNNKYDIIFSHNSFYLNQYKAFQGAIWYNEVESKTITTKE
jgi:hypothetical protein